MKKVLSILLIACLCLNITNAQTKKRTRNRPVATKVSTKKKATGKAVKKKDNKNVSNNSISGLRNEQARIKQNIRKQEQALRANRAQVQKKLKDIERLGADMNRRQQSIDSINTDLHRINNDIGMLTSQLDNLTDQLNERKASYVKSMRYMAKQRSIQSELMFIFSAKDLSQLFRRIRFVRQYAAYQRTQGKAIQQKQALVDNKRQQLHVVRGEKNNLLYKGNREKQALMAQKDEQQKIVSSLRNQQKTIQAVIDAQKKKDAALNAQIDKLVAIEVEKARQRAIAEAKRKAEQAAAAKKKAEELARKKAEARAAAKDRAARERAEQLAREAEAARIAAERKAAADRERSERAVAEAKRESDNAVMLSSADRLISGGFEANKGRMPSPVAGGRIVSHFGQHGVEGLPGVVLDNKGINILGSSGAPVRSIYDGEVSAVFNAGGSMGVLVRHGAYISVYCNLRSVSVSRGQKISARQTIGTVGRDNILQFQLRKERAKLNPEQWIAR